MSGAVYTNRAYVNVPCSPGWPYYAIEQIVLDPNGFYYQGEYNQLIPPAGQKFVGWRIFQNGKDTGKIAQPGRRLYADYNLLREYGTTTYLSAVYENIAPVIVKYPIYVYYYADYVGGLYLGQDRLPDAEAGTSIGPVDMYRYAPAGYTVPGTRSGDTVVAARTNTVYVVYTKPADRKVTYYPNGGAGSVNAYNVPYNGSYTIASQGYYRDQYTFKGWNTDPNGYGTAYNNGQTITVMADLTLYAQWDPIPVKEYVMIIYVPGDGGLGGVFYDMVEKNSVYSIRKVEDTGFWRPAGSFKNWNTDYFGYIQGTGTVYTPGQTILASDTMFVYAQWGIDT
jgi:uncharacterized repeat protein (TIGR02543 family)